MEKIFGYARVSSKEQNLDRQIEELIKYGVDERDIIVDKQSGKDFNRSGYKTLKDNLLRNGDTLVIKELDRLGRNMEQIKVEWKDLEDNGVNLVVIDSPILNTVGKTDLEKRLISNIVFELLSYMSEKERLKIKQRQAEGRRIVKDKGKRFGRPAIEHPKNWKEVYDKWINKEITAVMARYELSLKKNTFYKLVKQFQNDMKI